MNTSSFVSESYKTEKFLDFLQDFLPDDFGVKREKKDPEEKMIFKTINRLGQSDTLDLAVFEFYHSRKDPRVTLTRDAFKFLKNYEDACSSALVAFVNEDNSEYRFSFITCDVERDPQTQRDNVKWSNPRRFSFILGGGVTRRTPEERLRCRVETIDDLKECFSVEALTKDFYEKIKTWFLRAKKEVKFPGADQFGTTDEEHQSMMTLRLITRLIFIWFLKEKGLVPKDLFDEDKIDELLNRKKFSDRSPYYRAILQNLFFATLNTPRKKRKWLKDSEFHGMNKNRGKQEYFRYRDFFKDEAKQEEFYDICDKIPFVNGGLFENLDGLKEDNDFQKDNDKRIDCFSEERSNLKPERLKVSDELFFGDEGLIEILKQYNFTIEENTPNDEDVALDPELLGCVFEGLLSYVNSGDMEKQKGKGTEKKKSGSYYTPRVIVDYMVSESLKAYLSTKVGDSECLESLFAPDSGEEPKYKDNTEFKDAVAKALDEIKILDPACGSGAFPMGILSKMIQVLGKIGKIDIRKPHEIYKKKLDIIRDCIYGVDMQNIAVQISKLRFFISLLCEQEVDLNDENYGIEQLPNLETKIVCADSLIKISIVKIKDDPGYGEILKPESDNIREQLKLVREKHFDARSPEDKAAYRNQDKDLRKRLKEALRHEKGVFISKGEAEKLSDWDPYDPNSVSSFFNPEWMFGVSNFDILIGNPPYIKLERQENKYGEKLSEYYADSGYETFAKTGDIYCLFYERGLQILKDGGHLCFITSNKWMRSEYGESLRGLLAKKNPKRLIDFPGVKIFPNASVDPNILLIQKSDNERNTFCTTIEDETSASHLSDFVKYKYEICDFSTDATWAILSPIEQRIKSDIEKVGTRLEEWINKWRDINIKSGIKTACDPVFTIDDATRKDILEHCKEEEYARTEVLIRPLVKGEDVRRTSRQQQIGNWLINAHNGVRGRFPRIYIERDYPAVKAYLDAHWKEISSRRDRGATPYNLRNCAYLESFNEPKIIYQELSGGGSFSLDLEGKYFVLNSAYIITGRSVELLKTLIQFLNSKVVQFAFERFYATKLGSEGIRWLLKDVVNIPIPRNVQGSNFKDEDFYKIYGLDSEEIEFIESSYSTPPQDAS